MITTDARIAASVHKAAAQRALAASKTGSTGVSIRSFPTPVVIVGLMFSLAGVVSCRPSTETPPVQRSSRSLTEPADAEDLDPDPTVVEVRLTAALRPSDAPSTYGYNGVSPGPTIRARVGDELVAVLDNQLDQPTTIHWHGSGAPFEMDGVPWMRTPTMPGETFEYRFELTKAGTFWYHPHFNTSGQVEGGLYGLLIVEDPSHPTPDDEILLVFDVENEGHDPMRPRPDHGHGRLQTQWRINGQRSSELVRRGGQIVRARLLNASNAGYLALRSDQLHVIAGDQGLRPARQTVDRLVLGPGDRVDLEWSLGREDIVLQAEPYTLAGGRAYGDSQEVLRVRIDQPADAPAPLSWPFSGDTPSTDPGATDLLYAFAGSDRTGEWRINGEKFPNVTIETLQRGQTAIIEVRNLSPTEHPFHMHGNPFEILSVNGRPPDWRTIEDTWNLAIRDVVRLRMVANNPGDWMVHCHILPHADDGMMTVLRVQ